MMNGHVVDVYRLYTHAVLVLHVRLVLLVLVFHSFFLALVWLQGTRMHVALKQAAYQMLHGLLSLATAFVTSVVS